MNVPCPISNPILCANEPNKLNAYRRACHYLASDAWFWPY